MISILCPTRKRPDKFRRMVESVVETAKNGVEIVYYVDSDDHSYDDVFDGMFPIATRGFQGARITMSDMWNRLIPHANGELLMNSDDDCVFRTPGWNEMVEQVFDKCPDKILLCYGDDGGPNGKNFATHPIVHRRWIETIGYFAGPGFSADFADTWPQDVADMIGRKKLLPFVTEHLHYLWNKAPDDEVYRETRARMARDNTRFLYLTKKDERSRDAAKLRAVMDHSWKVQS
ncbi:MAG TPA: glycosyltransferase [Candidatus Binatia bacterium]|nr:glycosyltransferase [Candidatus Binatia bacterium]